MLIQSEQKKVTKAEDIYHVLLAIEKATPEEDKHKERFYAIGLNSQNVILYVDLVALGTVNYCVPAVRECLRLGITKNAAGLIVAHNHPSGNTEPSSADREYTSKIKEACKLVGISLLDHVIYTENNGYYSFADMLAL